MPALGGKRRRITFHSANDHVPSFSQDGNWIVLQLESQR